MKKIISRVIIFWVTALALSSCGDEPTVPKPKGYFRISVPTHEYDTLPNFLPYNFYKNKAGEWQVNKHNPLWGDIYYPSLRARIQITYKPVKNNIDTLLAESQKLAFKHTVKASGMREKVFENKNTHSFGLLYEINGNAASPYQFFITDSTHHFIRGAVYFFSAPNADSLKPATMFIENDVKALMESVKWRDNQ